jgi:hypothetical protein
MTLSLYKKMEIENDIGHMVIIWKFIDENGNLWNTETPINGTEEDAKQIILQSILPE